MTHNPWRAQSCLEEEPEHRDIGLSGVLPSPNSQRCPAELQPSSDDNKGSRH
jgi:hypothetical protein